MNNRDIKRAIDNVELYDERRTRIYNQIQIKSKKQESGIIVKMNNKLIGSVVAGSLVVCGVIIFNNNNVNKVSINEEHAGVSQMASEKLAVTGVIEEIETYRESNDVIIKVSGDKKDGAAYASINVHVHASTNIFYESEDTLLMIKDLRKGQKVEVYYDGTESNGQVSGMRIDILK